MKVEVDRVHHIVLRVTNLKASLKFYTEILGLEVSAQRSDGKAAFLTFGTEHHDLALFEQATGPQPNPDQPGIVHIAFRVPNFEALQEAYEELLEMGIEIDRTIQHNITNSVYVKDPDGIVIELFSDRFPNGLEVMKEAGPHSDHLDIRTGEVTPL